MKNQITFKGGIALMAMSFIFLSSCKKDEIAKKPIGQSENHASGKIDYKFSAVAKIPGENPENGYLSLKVSSNDEAYLKKYVAKLEQTKIVMAEVNSTKMDEKDVKLLFDEKESQSAVALDFEWKNFSFKREKGKMYQIRMASADQSKALVYYTAFNAAQFNFVTYTVATVNVYSLYNSGCTWYFNNTVNDFYSTGLNYHDNLEIRCFQNPLNNTSPSPSYSDFPYFTINGIVTYYSPRKNYVSPPAPGGFMDVNAIIRGNGYVAPFIEPTAALTFYLAG